MTHIPLAFCLNDQYVENWFICMQSILDHLHADSRLEVHVVDSGISRYHKELIQQFANEALQVSTLSIHPAVFDASMKALCKDDRSLSCSSKFLLFDLMQDHDQFLYLDCDTIVFEDISKLFEKLLPEYAVAAVRDDIVCVRYLKNPASQKHYDSLDLTKKHMVSYFNSGLMLVNCSNCRGLDIPTRVKELVQQGATRHFHDQDIFNGLFKDRVQILHPRWNVNQSNISTLQDLAPSNRDPYIYHYSPVRPHKWTGLESLTRRVYLQEYYNLESGDWKQIRTYLSSLNKHYGKYQKQLSKCYSLKRNKPVVTKAKVLKQFRYMVYLAKRPAKLFSEIFV